MTTPIISDLETLDQTDGSTQPDTSTSKTPQTREERFQQYHHKCTVITTYLESGTILDKKDARNVKNQVKKHAWDADSK